MVGSHPSASSVARSAIVLCIASSLAVVSTLRAQEEVDTELLLLIDVSGSIGSADYSRMMDAYADAMTSESVLRAIESGGTGKIATAVAFWSSSGRQTVGVDWMEISDIGSALLFAERIRGAARPFLGTTAIASALDFAVPLFGTETGGAENGFHGASRIIGITGDGSDNSSPPRALDRSVTVRAARDEALLSGVDMINGLALNTTPEDVSKYYEENVIGGQVGETEAFVRSVDSFEAFEAALTANLVDEISAGAIISRNQAVPEPSVFFLALPGAFLLLSRRRRSK